MTFNTFFTGAVIASLTVITTVAVIWFTLIIKQPKLYVPVSWLLTVPTIGIVLVMSHIYGLEATAGFVTAYFTLSWIPLFIGLHLGVEALSVLTVTSIIITIEFILIFLSQVLPSVPLSK